MGKPLLAAKCNGVSLAKLDHEGLHSESTRIQTVSSRRVISYPEANLLRCGALSAVSPRIIVVRR